MVVALIGESARKPHEKVRFVLLSFGGQILSFTICARRQPNHVKHLLSGLSNLIKGNNYSLGSPPGDPRAARCSRFRSDFRPPINFFGNFWLTIQNTANRHISNAFDFGFLSVDRN
jgi:hypothetical protein